MFSENFREFSIHHQPPLNQKSNFPKCIFHCIASRSILSKIVAGLLCQLEDRVPLADSIVIGRLIAWLMGFDLGSQFAGWFRISDKSLIRQSSSRQCQLDIRNGHETQR